MYNAESVAHLGAGVFLKESHFNAETIKKMVDEFIHNPKYTNNSKKAGEQLLSLGGVNKVVKAIEDFTGIF